MNSHKHKHKHDRMVMVDGVVVVTGLQYVCIFGVYDEYSYVCRCLPKRLEACFAVGYANVTRHSMAWHDFDVGCKDIQEPQTVRTQYNHNYNCNRKCNMRLHNNRAKYKTWPYLSDCVKIFVIK